MAIIDLPRTQAASGSTEQQLKAISDQIRVFRDQVERQLIDLESGTGTGDTAASSAALSQIVSDLSDIQNDIETIQSALPGKLEASDISDIQTAIETIQLSLPNKLEADDLSTIQTAIETIQTALPNKLEADDLSTIENSINTINTALGNKLDTTGDGKDVTVTATAAATKANLSTGEKLSVSIGKLMKWFTDFATVAWTGSYNDLSDKPSPSSAVFLDAHPVGSIYITTNSDESTAAQMATKYGGTWESWGSGRVPVGVDTLDTDFDTVGETGGAKTVALSAANNGSHTHTGPSHTHGPGSGSRFSTFSGTMSVETIGEIAGSGWEIMQIGSSGTWYAPTITGASGTGATGSSGSGTAHNNLQPYITCYMWKRTA